MDLFRRAIELYPYVFHPITVLGAGFLLLVRHEWLAQSASRAVLRKRVAAFLAAGILGLVPTATFFLLGRGSLGAALQGKSWRLDLVVAAGVAVASGATWIVWRRFAWGDLVPDAAVAFLAVTVPYAAVSPFWDVSGHVLFALAPTLYLALVDRSYWPLLTIPVLMAPNRVLVEAHTWLQSIAGFALAAAITLALFLARREPTDRRRPDSAHQ